MFSREAQRAWAKFNSVLVRPLTKIAIAIYEIQAIQNWRKGFKQIFHVPEFLSVSEGTSALVMRSVQTNVVSYIVPVVLYRRGVSMALEAAPDELDGVINGIDWAITVLVLLRLFTRRLIDNAVVSACLPKVIANDKEKYLPLLISGNLADNFAMLFKEMFLSHVEVLDSFDTHLRNLFHDKFRTLFLKQNIKKITVASLTKELISIFSQVINEQQGLSLTENFTKKFIQAVAKLIADEFILEGLTRPEDASEILRYRAATTAQKQNQLLLALKIHFMGDLASEYANKIFEVVSDTRKAMQYFLPIEYEPSCDCPTKKLIHAEIASPIYYLFNLTLTDIRNILAKIDIHVLEDNVYINTVLFIARILIFGQSLNEYKISQEGQCTRHRYKFFARNKMHGLGAGLAFYLGRELVKLLIISLTGVNSFFIRDAISNVVMQLNIIASLAYNEPLPGQAEDPADLFVFPRQLARGISDRFTDASMKRIGNRKNHESHIQMLKDIIHSYELRKLAEYILSGNDFISVQMFKDGYHFIVKILNEETPNDKKAQESKEEGDGFEEVENPSNLDQIMVLLLKNPSIEFAVELNKESIKKLLLWAEFAHSVSIWIARPFVALSIPGFLFSLFVLTLRILKDDAFILALNRLQGHLTQHEERVFEGTYHEDTKPALPSVAEVAIEATARVELQSTLPANSEIQTTLTLDLASAIQEPLANSATSSQSAMPAFPTLNILDNYADERGEGFELVRKVSASVSYSVPKGQSSHVKLSLFGLTKMARAGASRLMANHNSKVSAPQEFELLSMNKRRPNATS